MPKLNLKPKLVVAKPSQEARLRIGAAERRRRGEALDEIKLRKAGSRLSVSIMLPREPPGEKKRGLGVITIVIAVSLLLLAAIFVTGQYALYGQVGRLRAQMGWFASHMRCCVPLQMEMRETSSWRGRGARLARDAVRPLAAKCVPQDRCES